ncbi:MAG: DUF4388 domain-containing protein [Planctomycetota bacterium]|jgi:hypothetical protein
MSGTAPHIATELLSLADELTALVRRISESVDRDGSDAEAEVHLGRVRRHVELALRDLGAPRPLVAGAPSPAAAGARRPGELSEYDEAFAAALEELHDARAGLVFDERGALGVQCDEDGWVRGQVQEFGNALDVNVALGDGPESAATPEGEPHFSGNTDAISAPELIGFFQLQSKTGLLTIEAPGETFSLTYIDGDLCRVTSSDSPEGQRLGELLIGLGHLTDDQLGELLERKAPGLRIGELLRDQGGLSDEAISEALQLQVQGIFQRLCDLGGCRFTFHEGAGSDTASRRRYNVTHLLLETARRKDEHLHQERSGLELLDD